MRDAEIHNNMSKFTITASKQYLQDLQKEMRHLQVTEKGPPKNEVPTVKLKAKKVKNVGIDQNTMSTIRWRYENHIWKG
ncbi:hypothetical protein FRX31_012113 [Thalictrum thalictroides]|uniref:Uncharacterized protein n=1 Tax=Thalictrum thalictroides TaxID=46969 RepID=A0A7J6WNY1_THATH|nr:hypothetical protein FRX31_012113 [Thalictrum thalictroides]